MYTCIDTFPSFLVYWAEVERSPLEDQIESWANEYLLQWPELLAIQIEDYAAQNLDWRQIAREKVFPYLAGRLPAIKDAHQNLLECCEPIYTKAQAAIGFDANTTFVLHVGIGCGAGWATSFRGNPAILFGLENIAECGWSALETIKGLVAHEIGHLVHASWRSQYGKSPGSGPWWQLYEEGFAQACESLILDTELVHQVDPGKGSDWLVWCQEHTGWLAAEFLKTVDAGQPVSVFFGSWFEICGRSETGYFLGQEVIKELMKQAGLKDIASLDNIEAVTRPVLEKMAGRNGLQVERE